MDVEGKSFTDRATEPTVEKGRTFEYVGRFSSPGGAKWMEMTCTRMQQPRYSNVSTGPAVVVALTKPVVRSTSSSRPRIPIATGRSYTRRRPIARSL